MQILPGECARRFVAHDAIMYLEQNFVVFESELSDFGTCFSEQVGDALNFRPGDIVNFVTTRRAAETDARRTGSGTAKIWQSSIG